MDEAALAAGNVVIVDVIFNGQRETGRWTSVQALLRVCAIDAVLLDGFWHGGRIDGLDQGEATVLSAQFGFPLRGAFKLPSGHALIGLVHEAAPGGWCHGVPLGAGTLFTVAPEQQVQFAFVADTRFSLAVVPSSPAGSADAMPELPSLLQLNRFHPSHRTIVAFYRKADDACRSASSVDLSGLTAAHVEAAERAAVEERIPCTRTRRARYALFAREESYMRAHLGEDIYLRQLSTVASVSERGLRYAFHDLLAMPPNRYLTLLRLSAACRALARADAGEASVKSIALDCGLWDLSRFAATYRNLFDEFPHDTLVRRAHEPGPAWRNVRVARHG